MIAFIVVVGFFIGIMFGTGYFISAPRYRGAVRSHFNGRTFINPGGVKAKGFRDVLKWARNRERGPWKIGSAIATEKPVERIEKGLRVTFVNHSTFLIQVNGLNILTDPVWSNRTSPFSWIGPTRMRPPGIRFEDLPPIDVVLLSHNHYDHLDIVTMKKIFNVFSPKIITPLGVKEFLDKENVLGSRDMDWWEEVPLTQSTKVQAVPAQHFSGRGMFDRDATLWCGYILRWEGGSLYFVGDTGYNAVTFKEIGERCAPIQVALIPIGAYKPQWFMSVIHCSPEEAVQIHRDIKAKTSIATHFGTFPLADDGMLDPTDDLEKAKAAQGIPPGDFIALKEGESRDFS